MKVQLQFIEILCFLKATVGVPISQQLKGFTQSLFSCFLADCSLVNCLSNGQPTVGQWLVGLELTFYGQLGESCPTPQSWEGDAHMNWAGMLIVSLKLGV